MKQFNCLFFLILLYFSVQAQEYEPVRLELPARIDSKSYGYELLGVEGLMLFYESRELDENNRRNWYFSKLDTNLTEKWVKLVALSEGMRIHKILSTEERLVVLFLNNTGKKQDPIPYEIISFHLKNEKFSLMGGVFPAQSEISKLAAYGDKLMIGVNLADNLADLLFFNLSDGSLTPIDILSEGQYLIQEIDVISDSRKFGVFLKRFGSKRFEADIFLIFDSNGQLINRFEIADEQHRFLASVGFYGHGEEIVAIGTYEREKSKPTALKNAQETTAREAAGLFYLQLKPNGQSSIQYHPFAGLPNIDNALASEDLMRYRQQQSRGKASMEEADIAFQFYEPQLINQDSLLLFSAEAFRPRYRVESRIDYDFYGRPIPYTYTIFEGYQFFSTILVSFNTEGGVNWLNTFQIRDLKSYELERHVNVSANQGEVLAAFYNEGVLHSKLFDLEGGLIGEVARTNLDLRFSNDRLLEENFGRLDYWYSNYFVVTANQKINNSRLVSNNPRSVFFIQKIAFE
ncbi:MAG: hypothetical protein PHG67_06800 [Bacteroidales bacterium]|jgi:hypothetical protein|nr:hypothetical protein [Bacteroidales bacterium]